MCLKLLWENENSLSQESVVRADGGGQGRYREGLKEETGQSPPPRLVIILPCITESQLLVYSGPHKGKARELIIINISLRTHPYFCDSDTDILLHQEAILQN